MQLPAPGTTFFGRLRERAAIRTLLINDDVRLVTLSGPGGIGKTRLAVEVARGLGQEFCDGIMFVDLSPLSDAAQVIPAIAKAAGVKEAGGQALLEQVQESLRQRRLLLVIDNFEHVLAAAPELAALLGSTEHLKALLTSRVPLELSWEHVVPLGGLSLPAEDTPADTAQLGSEAVALFVDRARATHPGFAHTPAGLAAMAEICRRLDGLPLAIELSAARIRLLPPQVLVTRLDNPLEVLTAGLRDAPARQQTLRRTLEWSYRLLPPPEQRFFALLAVFAGRFTLDAVAAVAADDPKAALDQVQAMLNHSLLVSAETDAGEAVFLMLHTIRAFADERLAEDSGAHELRRRHAEFYLDLAERSEPELSGSTPQPSMHRLALAYDNLRAGFEWLLRHDPSRALRLAGALRRYWTFRGELSEARRWLHRALAAASGAAPAIEARALLAAADVAVGQTELAEAIELYERSLALWETLDDLPNAALVRNNLGNCYRLRGELTRAAALYEHNSRLWRAAGDIEKEAKALGNLGLVMLIAGNYARADALFDTSLAMFRRLGDPLNIARSLNNRGYALVLRAHYGEAEPILQESLARFRALEQKLGIADALSNLAAASLGTGDGTRARAYALESISLFEALGDQNGLAECLEHLAAIASMLHQPERATVLLAAATQLRTASGSAPPPSRRARLDTLQRRLRRVLGNKRFGTAWLLGEALSASEALALARTEAEPPAVAPAPVEPAQPAPRPDALKRAGLSRREIDVLKLLAGGLTYEQIADRLVISPRTVNRHLTSIYGKLNVESRHAAARWALDNQLV